MFRLITGASGSGKSEYAEQVCIDLWQKDTSRKLVYLATMKNDGSASANDRITRHRELRRGKGFVTWEEPYGYHEQTIARNQIVLVECISNLVANLLFDFGYRATHNDGKLIEGYEFKVIDQVEQQMMALKRDAGDVIAVTNEVFQDGNLYAEDTQIYLKTLGIVNQRIAQMADCFTEVIYGLPMRIR